jgi:hypothetical protein
VSDCSCRRSADFNRNRSLSLASEVKEDRSDQIVDFAARNRLPAIHAIAASDMLRTLAR